MDIEMDRIVPAVVEELTGSVGSVATGVCDIPRDVCALGFRDNIWFCCTSHGNWICVRIK